MRPGDLGAYVLRALEGHELRALDLTAPTGQQVDFRMADLRDLAAMDAALQGIEVVVHLGGIDRSVATDDAATMQVNVNGTWNVFEASRAPVSRRVIHCSSNSVTGLDQTNPTMPPCYLPIDEAHLLRPPTRTRSARFAASSCRQLCEARDRGDGAATVLHRVPGAGAIHGRTRGPSGRDEPTSYLRAYVGPEDCARGFAAGVALADYAGFETFFLAAADTFSTQPTVARLEALYGARIPLRDPALFERFPSASPVSHCRATARLGWTPTTRWSDDQVG